MSKRIKSTESLILDSADTCPGPAYSLDHTTSNMSNEEYVYEEDEDEEEDDDNYYRAGGGYTSAETTASDTPLGKAGPLHPGGTSSSGMFAVVDGSFRLADYEDIESVMTSLVADVSGLLQISEDTCISLLYHCRWNKERLVDSYYADPEGLLETAGAGPGAPPSDEQRAHATLSCPICGDETRISDAVSLSCNHQFCETCYSSYLCGKVEEGPSCIKTFCPMFKCKQIVPVSFFNRFADKTSSKKYQLFLVRNFIETNKSFRWCPSAGCEKVAIAGSGITTVLCNCGCPFCFKCGEEAHDPVCCSYLAEWSQKCSNESETANWILANTKKCTQCNARIEKNQGCNHMVCKMCKYEFCWICMGSWVEHNQATGGFYKCNRFEAAATDGTDAQKAKVELDRYLHYYQRYIAHDRSLKFATSNREDAERRMLGIQEAGKSAWIDVQFLKQAVEQVIDCRRVLKYTYVLGYFLRDHTQEKRLFEHHQEMLEKHTETLHHYTELSLESIDRTQVVNLTRVAEKFMGSLLASLLNSPDYAFKPVGSR